MRVKILLISPCGDEDILKYGILDIPYLKKKHAMAHTAPLALVTLAALTPPDLDIEIHDEHMRGPVEMLLEKNTYDIIGISMIVNQHNRAFAILAFCRQKKIPATLVVGGAGTSNMPGGFKHLVDVVFLGEAEETWPQFLRDFSTGSFKTLYRQISKIDLSASPEPRWELIRQDLPGYSVGAVQTTRGCPFDCIYCSVIYIYGRKPRSKPVENVMREIRTLQRMGVMAIFLTDDNFGINRGHAKNLLREIIAFNNTLDMPLGFLTQADITISRDEELLELMADANLTGVLMGIESINRESLQYFNKQQNLNIDITQAVLKIQSYGIAIYASIIIGADSDDMSAFQHTADFLKQANITAHACPPLNAPPGTKIWHQLKREGRLVEMMAAGQVKRDMDMDMLTNIVPKKMTRIELMEGIADYWETVFSPAHYMERAIGYINGVKRRPRVKKPTFGALWKFKGMMFRMVWYFLFQASPDHRTAFFTIMNTACRKAPYVGPHMILLYTNFIMEQKRARLAAGFARKQASLERKHPELIQTVERSSPIPVTIREKSADIFSAAYVQVRKKIGHREMLYRVVIDAMVDYVDHFGQSFEGIDEYQLQKIHESCDRILAKTASASGPEAAQLPYDHPPEGFDRDILDALDNAIRIREYTYA